MRNMFIAIATVIVFATVVTSSATAFDSNFQNGAASGSRFGGIRSAYGGSLGGYGGGRSNNLAGIRGYSSWRQGGWGIHRSVAGYGGYKY